MAFNLLLISIIWSMLRLDYACRFTICFRSATLLKALNRLIIDIISKCHPLWKQMWIALTILVRVPRSMWAAINAIYLVSYIFHGKDIHGRKKKSLIRRCIHQPCRLEIIKQNKVKYFLQTPGDNSWTVIFCFWCTHLGEENKENGLKILFCFSQTIDFGQLHISGQL